MTAPGRDRPFDILAFGDPNIDFVFATDHAPRADEKALGRWLGTFPGGTVSNFACAASRLGARVAGFGRVGDDSHGAVLLGSYRDFGVSYRFVRRVAGPSAAALIIVEGNGEKALVYSPMAPEPLDEAALSEALAMSGLVYAMPYDLDAFRTLSRRAHEAGVEVAIDIEAAVAPDRERLHALLACADIVFMNEGGFRATSTEEIEARALRAYLDQGPHTIVVTLGAAGALACDRATSAYCPAFPADLVDSTGAGDCFNGAFLSARLAGESLPECLAFACAAASLSVRAIGARAALPGRAEVLRLIEIAGRPRG